MKYLAAAVLGAALLVGCGENPYVACPDGMDSLYVDSDGAVTYSYQGGFAESFYELSGLEEEVQAAVREYNAEYGKETVSAKNIEKVTLPDGGTGVRLTLTFTEDGAVEGMTDVKVAYGTLSELSMAGYAIRDMKFTNRKTGETQTGKEILTSKPDSHVIVTNLKGAVSAESEDAYYSEGAVPVTLEDGSYIDTTNVTADYAVIILKK